MEQQQIGQTSVTSEKPKRAFDPALKSTNVKTPRNPRPEQLTVYCEWGKLNLSEVNSMRKSVGLRTVEVKERLCMRCSQLFISHGIANRLCTNCRRQEGE